MQRRSLVETRHSWTEGAGEKKGGRMSLRAQCSLDAENPGTWFLLLFLPLSSFIWGFGQKIPHWLASPAHGIVIKVKEPCSDSYWTLHELSVKDQTTERNLWAGHFIELLSCSPYVGCLSCVVCKMKLRNMNSLCILLAQVALLRVLLHCIM